VAVRRLDPTPDPETVLADAATRRADAQRLLAQAEADYERALVEYVAFVARNGGATSGRLVTVPEAAKALGISQASAWRQVASGEIPSRLIGRSRRGDLSKWNTA
jgi:hypothetical protein